MATDPVTAIGNALSEAFSLFKPLVQRAVLEKYEKGHKNRMEEWQEIMSLADSDKRADRMQSFVVRLCSEAGTPVGGFSGNQFNIPVEALHAFIMIISENIKQDGVLANLEFKTE